MSTPPENNASASSVDLTKHGETRPAASGPAWIVVPARVVAVVVVLPLRLVYDLLALIVRGLKRTPAAIWRFLAAVYMALLHPVVSLVARGAVALWSGLVWLWTNGVWAPLHWLVAVAILGLLRLLGRGTGKLARLLYSIFIAPLAAALRMLGGWLAWLGRGLLRVLEVVAARPFLLLWAGLAWVFLQIGRGLALAAKGIGIVLSFLLTVLIVVPATALWRYVLRPPLVGLAWLGRATGRMLQRVWALLAAGTGAVAHALGAALAWAWRMLGRLLSWVVRILVVTPSLFVYRYLLRPVGLVAAGGWRLAGRGLGLLWRTLVVAPSRRVKDAVLLPVGRGTRAVWRVSVRDPARWVRRSVLTPMREAGRDVRLQLRRAFRGG